jgi:DNA replication protein DnaC
LAIAVEIRACEENYRVKFRTAAGLINEMVEARNEIRLSACIRQFKKIILLIIDELGYVSLAQRAVKIGSARRSNLDR